MAGNILQFAQIGDDDAFNITDGVKDEARLFVANLHGKSTVQSLDVLCEHVLANSKGDMRTLPPTEDSFHYHLLRVLYQLLIFKRACHSQLNRPDVT